MVLGSHQFSRHANQHTLGSRTHRLGRRRLACSAAPLWHRPIYRQWGIPPRPETALASVARAIVRASMPRVICGGDQLPQQPRSHPSQSSAPFAQSAKQRRGQATATTTSSTRPKAARLSRQSHETATGTRIPNNQVLRPRRPQGRKRRESGGVTGVSLRNIPQDAKRLRSAKRDAEPLCMSEDVPERNPVTPPDSRWEF